LNLPYTTINFLEKGNVNMSKADTMLSILWLLRSRKRITAKQLSDELEIHIRTVYRHIDSLCASGVPIVAESGPNGGYQLLDNFVDTPLLFDMEEQKALVHASVFAKEAGYPFTDVLNRAIEKLKRYTNDSQLDEINLHSEGLSVIYPSTYEKHTNFLQILEKASAQGQSLEMEYDNGNGNPNIRQFDPYGIIHWKGRWYTVGLCHLRQELRSFRVDRIKQLKWSNQHFERPSTFSAKDFLLGNLLPNSLNSKNLVEVRIQGHERVLNELCQHWLFGHALINRDTKEALFRLGLPSLQTYVPYFLLSYGKSLVIHEPDILIEKMAEVSAGIATHYETMKLDMDQTKG
jgi:predicted DNA-binding transcriptional regulator YafY